MVQGLEAPSISNHGFGLSPGGFWSWSPRRVRVGETSPASISDTRRKGIRAPSWSGRDLGQNEVGRSELEQAVQGNRNWANPATVVVCAGNIRNKKEKGMGGPLED
jgi:hypothetical protein